jgi:hypothetical protein
MQSDKPVLSDLDGADRIVVTSNLNRPIKTVMDRGTLDAVLSFLRQQAEGWEVPVEGVPVASVRLNFYEGGSLLGNIGLDKTFLTAHTRGSFWSKPISAEAHAQLEKLLGLGLGNFKRP